MKLTLRQQITQFLHVVETELFPILEEATGELDDTGRRLVAVLEMVPLARFVPSCRGWIGRPSKDRMAIACAFVAKAVYGFSTTRQLIERLAQDDQLRRICGWKAARHLPHESTFSRAFAEFAAMELPQFVHEALIAETHKGRLVGHISRDSTAIAARERFPEKAEKAAKPATPATPKGGGRPRGKTGPHQRHKGGKPAYVPDPHKRLHQQRSMTLEEMLADLPRQCAIGVKTRDGNQQYWRGYKLHVDVADGQIPISALLTAASLHDTQAAIPMATMTARRVTSLYDVMDAGYDAMEIREHSRSLGHVPIIRPKKRRQKQVPFSGREEWEAPELTWAEADRFRERTAVERVYARLKDEFGGRQIRVRGAQKVMAHLMFGVLALTADQLLKLVK
jgi:IS5 family transposase